MILCIDTGLRNFGVAVIKEADNSVVYIKTIRTKKKKSIRISDDYARRISCIASELTRIIRKYPIKGVVGEMPTFGAKSSKAAIGLTSGATLILALCEAFDLPAIWLSPRKIKELFTGNSDASKQEMMEECCKVYDWSIKLKEVKTEQGIRYDPVYYVQGQKLGAGYFEHIADAIGAYHACKIKRRMNHEKERS